MICNQQKTKLIYDHSKIRGKITEKYKTQSNFSKAMGWSERTTSIKLNSEVEWKQGEIHKAIELLEIQDKEVQEYFFKLKVQ